MESLTLVIYQRCPGALKSLNLNLNCRPCFNGIRDAIYERGIQVCFKLCTLNTEHAEMHLLMKKHHVCNGRSRKSCCVVISRVLLSKEWLCYSNKDCKPLEEHCVDFLHEQRTFDAALPCGKKGSGERRAACRVTEAASC